MASESIKKNYLKKIKLIKKYNQLYYDKNKSDISDSEFDKIKKEIIDLEKKYSFLKSSKEFTFKIGWL